MNSEPEHIDAPAWVPSYPGFYWWRQDEFDTWRPLQVIEDHTREPGVLLVASADEVTYQCSDDPAHAWYGIWHPEKMVPPSR